MDKAIINAIAIKDADDTKQLIEAECLLAHTIADLYDIDNEPEQWPEGASSDNPAEEVPEERKAREEMKDRGFFG